jgi:glutamate-1-semialdehyde 2,1-aminomutase
VNAAVLAAVQNGNSSSLNCPEEIVLAELLIELHPWAERVRYARTGGESMAIAVRISRAATGRDVVAFCGYHGWHDWYLAANLGAADALGGHLLPGLEPAGVPKALAGTALPFGYNRLGELEGIIAAHGREIGVIVMEPIRSQQPDPGFLPGVRAAADRIGAVLVFDEISSGFRLNTGGAHLELGVEPDIAVFSKAMGNGYAIGAIIGRAAVMEAAQSTFISSTYWTERIGPAAAIATVRKHRRVDAGKHLVALGCAVQDGWRRIAAKHGLPIHVGGIPPLSHFALESPEASWLHAYFVQLMLDEGFLAGPRFYSMLAHTRTHVDMYLDACDGAFASIADAELKGDVSSRLRGAPASAGFRRLA